MANLQASTVSGTLTASTSLTGGYIQTNGYNMKEHSGTVSISQGQTVNIFGNNGDYDRMYGFINWIAFTGFITSGMVAFQLSYYGMQTQTLDSMNGGWSMAHSPTSGWTPWNCAFTNNSLGGTFVFTVQTFGGTYTSSYLTTRTK